MGKNKDKPGKERWKKKAKIADTDTDDASHSGQPSTSIGSSLQGIHLSVSLKSPVPPKPQEMSGVDVSRKIYAGQVPSIVLKPAQTEHILKMKDIPNLILWVLSETGELGTQPSFCFFKNKPLLQNVVLCLVPGVNAGDIRSNSAHLPRLHGLAEPPESPQMIKLSAPQSNTVVSDAFQNVLSGACNPKMKQKLKRDKKRRKEKRAREKDNDKDNHIHIHSKGKERIGESALGIGAIVEEVEDADADDYEVVDDQEKEKLPLHPLSLVLSSEEQYTNGYPMPVSWVEHSKGKGVSGAAETETETGLELIDCPTGFFAAYAVPYASQNQKSGENKASEGDVGSASAGKSDGQGQDTSSSSVLGSDFICTQPPSQSHTQSHEPQLFGIDCEMVKTASGYELARLSVVNAEKKVVIDEFVKPEEPVVDYVTQYSGITPHHLENAMWSWKDARQALLDKCNLTANDFLIGHSVENDLLALRLCHRRVLDTAMLFPHPQQGFKYSLKRLSSKYLDRSIQQGTEGHDSIEDATCALELAQLKVAKGSLFGVPASSSEKTASVITLLESEGIKSRIVARSGFINHYVSGSCDAIVCDSDESCVAKVVKAVSSSASASAPTPPRLTILQLDGARQYWNALEKEYTLKNACGMDGDGETGKEDSDSEGDSKGGYGSLPFGDAVSFAEKLKIIDSQIGHIADNLPSGSLFIVVLAQPCIYEYKILLQRRRFGKADGSWTSSDESCFRMVVQRLREALVLFHTVYSE